ncbi:PREDICTED: uncharacterized protein LOC108561692 [Nicrophorus vespilloides]|uniref:Uncharacterized protein LOC108561692 n=1 Tax=Nicrophorus vespilloides TaxID=110193 RepID=A0ABM1ML02_NICVS|nr:PREDICTED: uncharacterized protein LOC108561692 [Nicrophorus vespilloides]
MFFNPNHLKYLDISQNCIEKLNLKLMKQLHISIGILNENCMFNTYTIVISQRTLYIIGAVILVTILIGIIHSRRFVKCSRQNSETSKAADYDRISGAIVNDIDTGYIEPTNVYEEINSIFSARESSNYMTPRSTARRYNL